MKYRNPNLELPTIFSDDELAAAMKARAENRLDHDRWDPASADRIGPQTDGKPECTLEQSFPHICGKLSSLWGSDVCGLYLKSLIVSDRETRKGFPLDVIEDLLMLYVINEMVSRMMIVGPGTAKPKPAAKPQPR